MNDQFAKHMQTHILIILSLTHTAARLPENNLKIFKGKGDQLFHRFTWVILRRNDCSSGIRNLGKMHRIFKQL